MLEIRKDLVCVTWLDAVSTSCKRANIELDNNISDRLILTNTYGYIIREDKDGYAVCNHENDLEDLDITIIPKNWVKRITKIGGLRK